MTEGVPSPTTEGAPVPAACRPRHRLAMPKVSLRVRRLTLAPTETSIEVSSTPVDGCDVLEREQLVRITELSMTTSSTRRKLG
jgi:hypothetical protein